MQAQDPDFLARLEAEDRSLPEYVRAEFDEHLRCGVLDHGCLRAVCEQCYVALSCEKRGFFPKTPRLIDPTLLLRVDQVSIPWHAEGSGTWRSEYGPPTGGAAVSA